MEFFPMDKRTESRLESSLKLLVSAFLSLAEEQVTEKESAQERSLNQRSLDLGDQSRCINPYINPLL